MTPNTSWDKQADWYDNLLSQNLDSYQERVIKPNLLRLMAVKPGEKILDLACGNGFFSAAFCKAGADVVGVDSSAKLIAIAKKTNHEIAFQVDSADKLSSITDQSIDQVACIMAIQNMENIKGALAQVKRVLKSGGKFHLVMSHPAFRVPKQSSWGWDEKNKIQYRRIDRYLSESKVFIQMHPGLARHSSQEAKAADTTLTFHRPLQYYFKLFKNAGLVVANLEEWISDRVSEQGPRADAENRIRQEIPLFLYIQAKHV